MSVDTIRLLQDNISDPCEDSDDDIAYTIAINTLVFFTVWGISSVVDFDEFKKSFKKPPIYAGAAFQFLLMPLIGFITVLIFQLDALQSIALLILCASPGGSFSNWWCNLFNADLALSVSMTSLSTVVSLGFLPLNLIIYVTAFQSIQDSDEDDAEVEFGDLALTLGVVISAVLLGLFTGAKFPQFQTATNIIGNVAGMASILLGLFASIGGGGAEECPGLFDQDFFPLWIATGVPLLVGLLGVLLMTSLLGLPKPQRVAIALETAYQNTGISLAYTLSQGAAGFAASAVPVIYGGYEAGFFGLFMLIAWKTDWTYAPKEDGLIKVMFSNYQPHSDTHKRLFPNYYELKPEAEEFNKSVRNSFVEVGRRLSVGGSKAAAEGDIEEEEVADKKVAEEKKKEAEVQAAADIDDKDDNDKPDDGGTGTVTL